MGRKRDAGEVAIYHRLVTDECVDDRVPKGYVPVLVGREAVPERFLVPVKLFKDPCMGVLLEMAALELGYGQEGILRIPCDAEYFRRVISKGDGLSCCVLSWFLQWFHIHVQR